MQIGLIKNIFKNLLTQIINENMNKNWSVVQPGSKHLFSEQILKKSNKNTF